jgi:predicted house-cleaning noncanonical NTP pyrophosphatase (MazG superfamily)
MIPKLVRDKIHEQIHARGAVPVVRRPARNGDGR